MANVISSAIVNTPPPNNMADILNRRNKVHHLDNDTDEDMIPMFTHDVNGKLRNNKRLLPRRNWCSIREYYPGSTPPPTPPEPEPETSSDESPPPPPTRLQRTLSLTRGDVKPGNLIRRLSGRGPPPSNEYPPSSKYKTGDSPISPPADDYFSPQPKIPQRAATIGGNGDQRHSSAPLPRPGNFHRRPTNMSEKAAAKGGDMDNMTGHINLEHGLDIVLNCEANQKDPAGITIPYRLLIPALWYEGEGDLNTETYKKKGLLSRLGSIRGSRRNTLAGGQGRGNWGRQDSLTPSGSEGENEGEPEAEAVKPRRWSFGVSQRRQYRDQTPPVERGYGDQWSQRQRDFEDRNQQIGQTKQQPFAMPPRQQRQYGDLSQQQGQLPTSDFDGARQDSVDYHQHVDASPTNPNNGYPGRKPSKVDRMLGFGSVARANSSSANGGIKSSSFADAHGNAQPGAQEYAESDGYESEEYEEVPKGSMRPVSQGYGGIEAYSEKRDTGWRRFLNKVKDVEEKSSGRRAPTN